MQQPWQIPSDASGAAMRKLQGHMPRRGGNQFEARKRDTCYGALSTTRILFFCNNDQLILPFSLPSFKKMQDRRQQRHHPTVSEP